MVRNCVAAILLWLALMVGYVLFLWGDAPPVAAMVLASVVWLGLVLINSARYALRDWKARNRMARGERPHDGELVAATGEIRPTLDRLQSPFSGRDCVFYSYTAGPARGRENVARDYAGFGFARCSVYTPHGSFALNAFPVLEGFAAEQIDRDRAARYIESTQFDVIDDVREMVQKMAALYKMTPPVRIDWRIGSTTRALQDCEERVVATGAVVTVIGRYSAAANAIVSELENKGFLRMKPGGSPYAISSFPTEAVMKCAGGVFLIAAAHVVLWLTAL